MCAHFFKALSIMATGLVIKAMDDILDEEDPRSLPYLNYLGRGLLPYTVALFSIALACDFPLAFGLFWASYCVGMLEFPRQKLPSALKAGTESILGFLLMLLVLGFSQAAWSILIIVAVQFIDDYLDYSADQAVKAANLALALGREMCFLLALITFYISLSWQPWESVGVWVWALVAGNSSLFTKEVHL